MDSPSSRSFGSIVSGSVLPALAALLLSAACSKPAPPAADAKPAGHIELRGAGSTFLAPLIQRWAEAYHGRHPEIAITYDAVGSGDGVRRFIGRDLPASETIDFGASDAAMSDEELQAADSATLMLPVTAGCVAVIYQLPGSPDRIRLSREAYAGIMRGEITRWSDDRIARSNPNVSLTDLAIVRMVRGDRSGTTFAVSSHLAAIDAHWQIGRATRLGWPGRVFAADGNDGVANLVRNAEGSIGYVGLEYAKKLKLATAALENRRSHYIQPSTHTCSTALETWNLPENLRLFVPDPDGIDAYPIVTLSWVLLHTSGGERADRSPLWNFFRWCLKDGQDYAADLGYVPLPSPMATSGLDAIDRASAGHWK